MANVSFCLSKSLTAGWPQCVHGVDVGLLTCSVITCVLASTVGKDVWHGSVPDHDATVVLGDTRTGQGLGVSTWDDAVGTGQDCCAWSSAGDRETWNKIGLYNKVFQPKNFMLFFIHIYIHIYYFVPRIGPKFFWVNDYIVSHTSGTFKAACLTIELFITF